MFILFLANANALVRARLPRKPVNKSNLLPHPTIFKNRIFLILAIALFLIEWSLFVSQGYLVTFALANGIRPALSYQLISIMNAGSLFGRWAPGLLADRVGRFNTMIMMIPLCLITTIGLWLPATLVRSPESKEGLLICYALLFGFASGSNITLAPICVGQLCRTEDYGMYFATLYMMVDIGCLVEIPIAGEILRRNGGSYVGLIAFCATSYVFGLLCFVWARVRVVGWGLGKENIFWVQSNGEWLVMAISIICHQLSFTGMMHRRIISPLETRAYKRKSEPGDQWRSQPKEQNIRSSTPACKDKKQRDRS